MSLGKYRIPLGLGFFVVKCLEEQVSAVWTPWSPSGWRPGARLPPPPVLAVFQVSHSLKDSTVKVPRNPPPVPFSSDLPSVKPLAEPSPLDLWQQARFWKTDPSW